MNLSKCARIPPSSAGGRGEGGNDLIITPTLIVRLSSRRSPPPCLRRSGFAQAGIKREESSLENWMPSSSLRARLRPGRAHAPEGGPLSKPGSAPEGLLPRREALLSRRLGRLLLRGSLLLKRLKFVQKYETFAPKLSTLR